MSFITLTPLRYLTSELADPRAANANLIPLRICLAEQGAKRRCSEPKEKTDHKGRSFLLYKGYEKDIFRGL